MAFFFLLDGDSMLFLPRIRGVAMEHLITCCDGSLPYDLGKSVHVHEANGC